MSKTRNAHCARATIELLEKETPELIPPRLWPPNSPGIWIQLITLCGKYCKRSCTNHASLIWSYRRRRWRMAAAMTTWSSLANSVVSRCFSSSISAK